MTYAIMLMMTIFSFQFGVGSLYTMTTPMFHEQCENDEKLDVVVNECRELMMLS